jgi:hypothetical protein
MSASSEVTDGVHLPEYALISGNILRQFEHASSITSTSTDDSGEMFALFAEKVLAENVPSGAVMVIPLTAPTDDDLLDFTFLAKGRSMFVKIHEVPRARNTYGHVASYSAGTADPPYPVGTLLMFATTTEFVIAKQRLVTAIMNATGAELELPTGMLEPSAKRPRQLEGGGESTEDAMEKPKGTYLQDLDDQRHFTRNKTDVAKRELELNFIFRAMDIGRRDYCMSTDLILQTESYRGMLCEQGDTIPNDRHEAFMSCGIMSRIGSLLIFSKKEKLKALLTGSVLVDGSSDPSLTLDDFITTKGEKICSTRAACPNNNVGMIQALKNLQTVMQIVFSAAFAKCMDEFIYHLEGELRPMEAVAADFLRDSIELAIKKFFRVVRSVKGSALKDVSVKTPDLCASYLASLLAKVAADLSIPSTMLALDNYFRFKVSRRSLAVGIITPAKAERPPAEKPTVKFTSNTAEEPKTQSSKPCSGHFGGLLGAVKSDGRKYRCSHPRDCTFRHISVSGKSSHKLLEIAASMPPVIRSDLTRAIEERK